MVDWGVRGGRRWDHRGNRGWDGVWKWFSTRVFTPGDNCQYLETLFFVTALGGDAMGIWWIKDNVKVAQSHPTLCTPRTIQSMEFFRTEYWSGYSFPLSRVSSQPGREPRSPALQVDSLSDLPQGKPKNTGVGSLSLLQWIFHTQESNQGLQYCRWILYQLSYRQRCC